MAFAALPANLARVREHVARIQAREGLTGDVTIVAVTKGHPAAAARAALEAGLSDVGENRVQEALAKQAALGPLAARWHLVGHLQTNKAKHVPGRFVMVHSVDSVKLVEALDRAAASPSLASPRAGASGGGAGEGRLDVLVQVNVAGEEQKFGCDPLEAEAVARRVTELPRLRLCGLMTMAPLTDDEAVQRRVFAALRRVQQELEANGLMLPELSMGMSSDYPAAVAEGATLLRLGTVLFGGRAS